MTLRKLQYLVAMAEHQHFSDAAQACNVTQSTLSNQLKQLEGFLDVVLFEREQKPVLPTPAGHHIISLARIALLATEEIRISAKFFRSDHGKVGHTKF